jgi:hypothetical protein
MKPIEALTNKLRDVSRMFPGAYQGFFGNRTGHSHKKDFKWPDVVTFDMVLDMYNRNGLAEAAIERTVLKTWSTTPRFQEDTDPEETPNEKLVRDHLASIRFWQRVTEADRRSMVGGYAGVILRVADGKTWEEPLRANNGGVEALVEIIPAWRSQLTVETWDTDQRSDTYGQPLMFYFREIEVPQDNVPESSNPKYRQVKIHPDRVVIFSKDGTVEARSSLAAGYNALMDCEKISGAGGEGFWKIAKASPYIEIDKDVSLDELAKGMGVKSDEVLEKMNDQLDDYQKGFDQMMLLHGLKATNPQIILPSPEHFFGTSLQIFAASFLIPVKILVGSQTGERASQEDGKEWVAVCTARRDDSVIPVIQEVLTRLMTFGLLPSGGWFIDWEALSANGAEQRSNRAQSMADVNFKSGQYGDIIVFTDDEIREVAGFPPLTDDQRVALDKLKRASDLATTVPEATPEPDPEEIDDANPQ